MKSSSASLVGSDSGQIERACFPIFLDDMTAANRRPNRRRKKQKDESNGLPQQFFVGSLLPVPLVGNQSHGKVYAGFSSQLEGAKANTKGKKRDPLPRLRVENEFGLTADEIDEFDQHSDEDDDQPVLLCPNNIAATSNVTFSMWRLDEDELLEEVLALSLYDTGVSSTSECVDSTLQKDDWDSLETPPINLDNDSSDEESIAESESWVEDMSSYETTSEWSSCDRFLSFRHALLEGSPVVFSRPSAKQPLLPTRRPMRMRKKEKDEKDHSAMDYEGYYLARKADNKKCLKN